MLRGFILCSVITILIPLSFMSDPPMLISHSQAEPFRSDLSGIHAAIYLDDGALAHGAFALMNMFDWMNATTAYIDAEEIIDSALDNYDILVFPGGSTAAYNSELGAVGRAEITEFVASGGSYFGICGGAMLGTHTTGFGLFNGFYSAPVAGLDTYLMDLAVNRSSTGPDLSDEPENYTTMYWGSAYFYGDGMSEAIPIMTYPDSGQAVMIACRYELGTVYLSSPHPEYEEGDERDGTSFCDELNDPDSEWGLLLKVSIWLVEVAETELPGTTTTTITTTTTTTTTNGSVSPMVIAPLAGGIGIIAIVVVLIRRR
jgi:glutamine amidotransferase-like uncharacterized protein